MIFTGQDPSGGSVVVGSLFAVIPIVCLILVLYCGYLCPFWFGNHLVLSCFDCVPQVHQCLFVCILIYFCWFVVIPIMCDCVCVCV